MKRYLTFLLAISIATGCDSHHSVSKDFSTGLQTSSTGLKSESVFLADANDNRLGTNQIHLGSTIKIIATEVSGLVTENGRVYPGCSIEVTGNDGIKILTIKDAFDDMPDGINKDSATVLKARLTTGSPMKAGEKYQFRAVFFDKRKAGNQIKSEIELVMQ